jgi:hypothetical protein
MAVEELGPGRPRGGVVMLAGALDLRPIPLGGGVVDGEDQRRVRPLDRESPPEDAEQGPGEGRGLATDAAEQVVIALEVAPGGAGPQPTGDGAAAAGEGQSGAERDEPRLLAGVERPGQAHDPGAQRRGQPSRLHPRLSFACPCGRYQPQHAGRAVSLGRAASRPCPLKNYPTSGKVQYCRPTGKRLSVSEGRSAGVKQRWHRPSRRVQRCRIVPHAGAPAAGTVPPPGASTP